MISHLGNFFGLARAKGKEAHVVQTWTAHQRPTYIQGEFMWLQWKAEYGTAVFNPNWIKTAANSFLSQMGSLAQSAIVHTELSEFSGSAGTVRPTSAQFLQGLKTLRTMNVNFDVYDYAQVSELNLWSGIAQALQ